jgi:stage III sporulation protein AF
MDEFNIYIRNIAYFIIFRSFLSIISPTEKYKPYIKFVSGLIMIIIVITPVMSFISGVDTQDLLGRIQNNMDMGIIEKERGYYSDIQLNMVMDEYKEELTARIEHRLNDIGYRVLYSECEISTGDEDFGNVTGLYVNVSKETGDKADIVDSSRLITVDKISIDPVNHDNMEETNSSESDEIKMIKNYISDFYNLSVDNIHIKIEN